MQKPARIIGGSTTIICSFEICSGHGGFANKSYHIFMLAVLRSILQVALDSGNISCHFWTVFWTTLHWTMENSSCRYVKLNAPFHKHGSRMPLPGLTTIPSSEICSVHSNLTFNMRYVPELAFLEEGIAAEPRIGRWQNFVAFNQKSQAAKDVHACARLTD